MWFFVQLCSSWRDFMTYSRPSATRIPSAIAELVVLGQLDWDYSRVMSDFQHEVYEVSWPLTWSNCFALLAVRRFTADNAIESSATFQIKSMYSVVRTAPGVTKRSSVSENTIHISLHNSLRCRPVHRSIAVMPIMFDSVLQKPEIFDFCLRWIRLSGELCYEHIQRLLVDLLDTK